MQTRRTFGFASWLACGLWLGPAAGALDAQARVPVPASVMTLPGDAAGLAQAAGLADAPGSGRLMVEVIRRLYHVPDGEARASAELAAVSAWFDRPSGEPQEVPLPLGPDLWSAVVFEGQIAPRDLARAILTSRKAAGFYHGLVALDAETTTWVAASRERIRRLSGPLAEVFSVFGRSLRVSGGRLQLPGGPEAEAVWSALLDESIDDTEALVDRVLTADAGRLAWMYDVLSHLSPQMQRHLLGGDAGLADVETRVDRLRALAEVFARVGPGWQVAERPFWRPLVEPGLLLEELELGPEGRLRLPAGSEFWGDLLGSPPSFDAAWLAHRVLLDDTARQRERLDLVLFVQRTMTRMPGASLAERRAAARLFARHPVLALSIERMELSSPTLAAALTGQTDRIGRAGRRDTLAVFQAALACLERARLTRVLDAATTERLVMGLTNLPTDDPEGLHRQVTGWLLADVASALGRRDDVALEAVMVAALAGLRPQGSRVPPRIEWEGQAYDVDPAAAEHERILEVRRAQGGLSLDEALAFSQALSRLAAGGAGTVASTVEILERLAPRLAHLADRAGDEEGSRDHELAALLARGRAALARLGPQPGPKQTRRIARQLAPAACGLVEAALVGLVYAAHLPADQAELLAGRIHLRHDFGDTMRQPEMRARTPWSLAEPVSGPGVPWHLRGSLLSLDLPLAPQLLRRLSDDPPSPTLPASARLSFVRAVALLNPADLTDAGRDRLVETIARGRSRLATGATSPAAIADIATRAGLSEWRRSALVWDAQHGGVAVAEALSITELFRLGEDADSTAARAPAATPRLDAWGTPLVAITGALGTRVPRARAWEEVTGHAGTGRLAAQVADLTLRIAEWLHARQLPAALARGILAAAVPDLVDRVRAPHPDDWRPLVAHVHAIPETRFEDYTAALTAGGPLRPVAASGSQP